MQIIYTSQELPKTIKKSIFLAGGTVRTDQEQVKSWRKDAIRLLEEKGFDGTIFSPEYADPDNLPKDFDYDAQIAWEQQCLNIADIILFWIPRDLSLDQTGKIKLPCFTSNVEIGLFMGRGNIVYGAPEKAEKNKYIDSLAEKLNIKKAFSLEETLDQALDRLDALGEVERNNGEVFVPSFIWKTSSFQSWYQNQLSAGNELKHAELLYNFRPKNKDFVFLWILKVAVYIKEEDRIKDNEFVIARPDISSILLLHERDDLFESEVIIIKEFRSPANTADGFIRELPSGSSKDPETAQETASHELQEETDFYLNPSRLKFLQARQLAGTLSSHKAHLFVAKINDEELEWFKSQDGIMHGNIEDTEQTYIEVKTVQELINNQDLDWSNLGQIFMGLFNNV